ncbi:MAG: FeoB-associated Cys-rich membrane protein [Lachnospiraceae bacterium]|nr:FeoB-associated Cys-rich membrane protein [Lachnospiraceae bacterium]
MNGLVADAIISMILAAAVISAAVYMYRKKKSGSGCTGCSHAGSCPHSSLSECGKQDKG